MGIVKTLQKAPAKSTGTTPTEKKFSTHEKYLGPSIAPRDGSLNSAIKSKPVTTMYMPKHVRVANLLQRQVGNTRFDSLFKSTQANIAVVTPSVYQQDVDRKVSRVVASQNFKRISRITSNGRVQPTMRLEVERVDGIQRLPEDDKKKGMNAKENGDGSPAVSPTVESGICSIQGRGRQLSESTRSFFEPRFGSNFSGVRVHTDTNAASLARSVNAKAFTVGRDIVFGAGQYSPETSVGKKLLAHELAHVAQQSRDVGSRQQKTIKREYEWEEVQVKREYTDVSKIPRTFNYELIQHKLVAHNVTEADLEQISELVVTLNLYYGVHKDKKTIMQQLKLAWQKSGGRKGGRASVNITGFLTKSLQDYLKDLEKYYEAFRVYIRSIKDPKQKTPKDIWDDYEPRIAKAPTALEKKRLTN